MFSFNSLSCSSVDLCFSSIQTAFISWLCPQCAHSQSCSQMRTLLFRGFSKCRFTSQVCRGCCGCSDSSYHVAMEQWSSQSKISRDYFVGRTNSFSQVINMRRGTSIVRTLAQISVFLIGFEGALFWRPCKLCAKACTPHQMARCFKRVRNGRSL